VIMTGTAASIVIVLSTTTKFVAGRAEPRIQIWPTLHGTLVRTPAVIASQAPGKRALCFRERLRTFLR